MMKKKLLATAVSVLALGSAPLSFGFEAGDLLLRVGVANVNPDSSPGKVPGGVPAVGGADVDVDDNTQLGLNVAYFITDNLAVELLAATPFKHDIQVGGGDAGETKHLPPTVSVNWYPLGPDSALQPYVGAGLNYTIFFEDTLNAATASTLAGAGVTVTDFEIDDSFGLAAQVGVDYQVNDQFYVNGQIRYIDISTDANIRHTAGNVKFDVDIDPMVYMISLGYKI